MEFVATFLSTLSVHATHLSNSIYAGQQQKEPSVTFLICYGQFQKVEEIITDGISACYALLLANYSFFCCCLYFCARYFCGHFSSARFSSQLNELTFFCLAARATLNHKQQNTHTQKRDLRPQANTAYGIWESENLRIRRRIARPINYAIHRDQLAQPRRKEFAFIVFRFGLARPLHYNTKYNIQQILLFICISFVYLVAFYMEMNFSRSFSSRIFVGQ